MNILHIYKDYYPVLGGIENHIKILAEAHAAAGHQVTVLVCNTGSRSVTEVLNGVEIVKAGRIATFASMPLSLAQPLTLFRSRYDIAHVHSPYPLGEFANWLLGHTKVTILTHHSDVVRQRVMLKFYGPILRRVLRSVDRIIATSPRYIDSSPWLYPVRDKCVVVPLGVDINRFKPPDKLQSHPFALLFVGKLRYYKGLDTLLQALPLVPQAQLIVVGEGPMQQTWQSLSIDLGLRDRVNFVGEVGDADLPDYYHQADLFVLPANARSEAFGMVLLEAMASGLPCITTELGTGTSWIVQDGITGFVVPLADPPALAKAINTLRTDEPLRQQFGQSALTRVRAEFSQETMVKRIMRLYEELLGSKTGVKSI